jgi:predicted house-cleaning NTP pyrophosphatase (Maf/HAM1 superfamily)
MFISAPAPSEERHFMSDIDGLANLKSVDLSADIAAVSLVLTGQFDEKIKEYTAAKADFEKIGSFKAAEKKAAKLVADAEAQLADVIGKGHALDKRENSLADRENAMETAKANFDLAASEVDKKLAKFESFEKFLDAKEASIKANAEAEAENIRLEKVRLTEEHQRLATEREAFNAKLAALRA